VVLLLFKLLFFLVLEYLQKIGNLQKKDDGVFFFLLMSIGKELHAGLSTDPNTSNLRRVCHETAI
jgi:hypothetical protein